MMILRVLGVWSLVLAMVVLTIDGTKSLASGDAQWVMTPLGEHWFKLDAPSLNLSQAVIERYVHPFLWEPLIVSLLQVPTWMFFGLLGLVLIRIGSKRRRINIYD